MPFQPKRWSIADELARDLLSGNPDADESDLYYIEPSTALDWARAPDQAQTLADRFSEAVSEMSPDECRKIGELVPALLGDISADKLLELRDLLRGALITHARREIAAFMKRHEIFEDAVSEYSA